MVPDYARGGIVVAGLIYLIFVLLIKVYGTEKILRFFPPIVTGPIIITISMTFAPNAIDMAFQDWLLSLFTLAVIVGISIYARDFLKIVLVIIGLAAGYILAVALKRIDYALLLKQTG